MSAQTNNNKLPALKSWEVKQGVAVAHAAQVANDYGLPQTVYRNSDTSGWSHTNALANLLSSASVFVTTLPKNYFT